MSYLSAGWQFFKRWFLPMPAHDDPRFGNILKNFGEHDETGEADAPPESDVSNQTEQHDTSTGAHADIAPPNNIAPIEPIEQVYGEPPTDEPSVATPVIDPEIAEGTGSQGMSDNDDEDNEYDPSSDRDFALGEPDENRDNVSDVDYNAETSTPETAAANEPEQAEPKEKPIESPQTSKQPNNLMADERIGSVKKAKPLPVDLPEGANARASRANSKVNPFTQD